MPYLSEKRTMVCGLDVYHDKGIDDGDGVQVSCMGFVASYNRTCTKYWPVSKVISEAGSEIAMDLKNHVTGALEHFKEANGAYPERVILYRDGFQGKTDFAALKHTEVA